MGCGNLFYILLVTFSVALITYNIIISPNAPLKQELPGPLKSSSISLDPVIKMPLDRSRNYGKKRLFHTAVTASDSAYNTWQCRIMYYYWFKKFRDGPNSEMGGFTRILHSGKADKFMDEIPTFVAQPLPPGTDQGKLTYAKIGEWRFDKRSCDNVVPLKNLPLPPPGVPESAVCLISFVKPDSSYNWYITEIYQDWFLGVIRLS
ncbi:hydroxyproline O-arabinosyltransferase 1-like isoform X2 [Mangifera indica]|uniref:hydroxyproline O-arabinosyltransferase 1-like isoform X2 n=1 Tax=Mangifera indica TaxID=29780 RepID=UPI001CFA2517|nr:hydroxyproline O-arabinosyltransferase 1-like isoform X2 [Mangifera indica]